MRFALPRCFVALLGVVGAACGSGGPLAPASADGSVDTSSDASPEDPAARDGSPKDGSLADGSVADAASDGGGDAGISSTGSMPPAGATICGSGTISPTDSNNVCQTTSPSFPPFYNVTKACGGAGFSFSSGVWEAWCTPSTVYLFARFDDAVGFETGSPWGNFQSGSGAGSANAYFESAKKRILVSAPNAQLSAKAGQLYLMRFDGLTSGGVSNFRIVGGVALTWK